MKLLRGRRIAEMAGPRNPVKKVEVGRIIDELICRPPKRAK